MYFEQMHENVQAKMQQFCGENKLTLGEKKNQKHSPINVKHIILDYKYNLLLSSRLESSEECGPKKTLII